MLPLHPNVAMYLLNSTKYSSRSGSVAQARLEAVQTRPEARASAPVMYRCGSALLRGLHQADHFHLDRESSRDLGGGAGLLCLGEERGVVLGAWAFCVPVTCARTHSYTALHPPHTSSCQTCLLLIAQQHK